MVKDPENSNSPSGPEGPKILLEKIAAGTSDRVRDSQLSQCNPEELQQALCKGMIVMAKAGYIPEFYITHATATTKADSNLQKVLQQRIVRDADKGRMISNDIASLLTAETKRNEGVQSSLRKGILHWTNIELRDLELAYKNFLKAIEVLPADTPTPTLSNGPTYSQASEWFLNEDSMEFRSFISLAATETRADPEIQSSISRMMMWWAKNGRNIPEALCLVATNETQQLPEVQNALLDGIVRLVSRGLSVPKQFFQLATQDTKSRPEIQAALIEGAPKLAENPALDMSDAYFVHASEETKRSEEVQSAMRRLIERRAKENKDIPDEYLAIATDETAAFVRDKHQDTLRASIQDLVAVGLSHQNLLRAASAETRDGLRDEAFMRSAMNNVVSLFFEGNKEMTDLIQQRVDAMSQEEMEHALFVPDMPVGVKMHVRQHSPFVESLKPLFKKTGGFTKKGYETCYIAPPIHNLATLRVCLDVLEKKAGALFNEEDTDSPVTIQVCVPQRLDNEACGMATLAFLLGAPHTKVFTPEELATNRSTGNFLTIYDGGGELENRFAIPMVSPRSAMPVDFKGRTDIILCQSRQDIENAHLALTLLVGASHDSPIAYKELGQRFIRELRSILGTHKASGWLSNRFVGSRPSEDEQRRYEDMLLKLTAHKQKDAENVRKINKDVTNPDDALQELHRLRYRRLLTIKIQDLLGRFRSELYNTVLPAALKSD